MRCGATRNALACAAIVLGACGDDAVPTASGDGGSTAATSADDGLPGDDDGGLPASSDGADDGAGSADGGSSSGVEGAVTEGDDSTDTGSSDGPGGNGSTTDDDGGTTDAGSTDSGGSSEASSGDASTLGDASSTGDAVGTSDSGGSTTDGGGDTGVVLLDLGGGASSSDDDSGGTTTGGLDGSPFAEVTEAVGIVHHQGVPMPAGSCLIDAVTPPIAGLFCSPERYAGGAAVVDFDGDDRLDVFITRPYEQDLLYRNIGDGTFVDVASAVGLVGTLGTSGAAFADVDNDGDQDLYVTTLGEYRHYLFIQEDGVFTEDAVLRGAAIETVYQHAGSTAAFADYDLDGDLDLYVGEWRTHAVGTHPSHARLLQNLGPAMPGYFEDVTLEAGILVDDVWETVDGNIAGTFVLSVGWSDLDGDGYPDLMLASDFAASRLFWNEGDGTFVDGTVASGVGTDENGMGSASADYDGDGDFDWFVTSITNPNKTGNRMYRNEGDRMFSDATDEADVRECGWGWGAAFFDHDLDGDLDLAATNGWYATAALADPMIVWTNYDGLYVPEQDMLGLVDDGQGRALVTFDADGDGDLELLVVNNRDEVAYFRNDTPIEDRHWLRVEAPGGQSNRDGIGAIVRVETVAGVQVHEIGGSSHYLGHGAREAHFGLGTADSADVRVDWPASGEFVELTDVEVDQVLVVPEPAP